MRTYVYAIPAAIAAYLFTAFSLWELDPAQWPVVARVFSGWGVAILFSVMVLRAEIIQSRK